jgi:hypothetical protein
VQAAAKIHQLRAEGRQTVERRDLVQQLYASRVTPVSENGNYAAFSELQVEHASHPALRSFTQRRPAPIVSDSPAIVEAEPAPEVTDFLPFVVPDFPSLQKEAPPSPRTLAMASVSGKVANSAKVTNRTTVAELRAEQAMCSNVRAMYSQCTFHPSITQRAPAVKTRNSRPLVLAPLASVSGKGAMPNVLVPLASTSGKGVKPLSRRWA